MFSTSIAKSLFCVALVAVVLVAGWASFSPVTAGEGDCQNWCFEFQGLCPPGQAMNFGRRNTGFGTCCIGCGGGCVPIEECSFGPHGCTAFCSF